MRGAWRVSTGQDSLSENDAKPPVTYFDSTLGEAMALAREAREYLTYQDATDRSGMNAKARLAASCESMRLTARLTQVVAWLLVQKAVHAGELTREQAAQPRYRLGGQEVCEEVEPLADGPLPERLSDLMERSLGLYRRVARLDAMLDRDTA